MLPLIVFPVCLCIASMFAYIVWSLDNISYKKAHIKDLEESYRKLLSQKKSSEVRLGQISENLAPFLKEFKYDPKKCHFLGNPIDYVIFEEGRIVFLEIKSGESVLSSTQRNIRDLIKDGKIYFDQMRIK